MGYAVVLGVFGAVSALVFLAVIKFVSGTTILIWVGSVGIGGGWWLPRRPVRSGGVPFDPAARGRSSALFADLQLGHVDPGVGARGRGGLDGVADRRREPGPEKALGSTAAAATACASKGARQGRLPGEHPGRLRWCLRRVVLQHGDRGAADLEVARPGGQRLTKALAAEIVASSVSFGIYFAIAGAVFLMITR